MSKQTTLKRVIKCTVPSGLEAPGNIVDYLAERFTYFGRQKWQEEIGEGKIRINSRIAISSDNLGSGDRIEYVCPPLPEPVVNSHYRIIFEDADLLVIDKPAGLPCHPHGRYFNNTLWALLKNNLALPHFSFINRLDRETSGIVLVAKSKKIASICQLQFKNRKVIKKYAAIVRGYFPDFFIAEGFLQPDGKSTIRHKKKFVFGNGESEKPKGKEAITVFRRLRAYENLSLIEAEPLTGRQHQIRATLEALKHYLVGDKIYGEDEGVFHRFVTGELSLLDRKKLLLPRQALHAAAIFFQHPTSGEQVHFLSPWPEDFGMKEAPTSPLLPSP